MNIDSFKENITFFFNESQKRIETHNPRKYERIPKDTHNCLLLLYKFLQDDQNIKVLKNYDRSKEIESIPPLGYLCKSVLDRFQKIDAMIQTAKQFVERGITDPFGEDPIVSFYSRHHGVDIEEFLNPSLIYLLNAVDVLKHLEGHNKTLIVLGPNGSGKTSLANYLKKVDAHVKVIPASKPIRTKASGNISFKSSIDNYNEYLYNGSDHSNDLMQTLITGMCNEHDNIARAYMETKIKEKETIYEKVKKIFDDFFDVTLDNSEFASKELCAKKEPMLPYKFNNMSDGERTAFFYIATVIAAPAKSFIVVDEPENHLNPAIYNKIWDRLIETRKDCQFIFITHTMDFVSARSNYEIVRIEKFVYPDKFNFEFLGDSIENIRSENILEVVGSRKPILFCEGDKTGLDYCIYECLFGNKFTIIPTGDCSSVKRSVEACNLHASLYSIQSAIGIVDSDLKSEEETKRLMEKSIYTLKLNEIEMLLVDENVIRAVLNRAFKSEDEIEKYKDSFFRIIDERKQYIIKRLTKTIIDEKLNNTNIDDAENTTKEQFKTHLNSLFTSIDIDKIWDDCERKITRMINEKNYDEALRYCCLEHGEIVKGLGNRMVNDYMNIALGLIRTDSALSQSIRNKYFKDIDAYLIASST